MSEREKVVSKGEEEDCFCEGWEKIECRNWGESQPQEGKDSRAFKKRIDCWQLEISKGSRFSPLEP